MPGHTAPICFYGDDFTGATAHLAGFHEAGLRALLFFDTPDEELLRRHAPSLDVIGIAGIGRSLTPPAMRAEILPALQLFERLGSRQIQYKICSTFDSSPTMGSIGVAIELGREVFGERPVPVVAGAPGFGRYTVFGNHFASSGTGVERLDRHPSMANHPSTPMREADLRRHLAEQTALPIGLVDVMSVQGGPDSLHAAWQRAIAHHPGAVVFDTLHNGDLDAIAQLLLNEGGKAPVYSIAAQGLAEGLGRSLRTRAGHARRPPPPRDVERMLVLSGSAAQLNEAQLQAALDAGWSAHQVDVIGLLRPGGVEQAAADLTALLDREFSMTSDVVLYTAHGAQDRNLARTQAHVREHRIAPDAVARAIGELYSRLTRTAVKRFGLRRIVLAGGDTASHAMRLSDAYALEIVANARGGGRLCRLLSHDAGLDGVEVMLKGGQVGNPRTFIDARHGRSWV